MDVWKHADKVTEAIRKYVENPEPDLVNLDEPLDLRKLAAELELLPATLDWGGCYAIRADGQIFSFLWDSPYELRPEDDPRIINTVLYQASQRYPELAELKPQRPANTQMCSFCKGTGNPLFGMDLTGTDLANQSNHIVCYCGNLGWLPPGYKTP